MVQPLLSEAIASVFVWSKDTINSILMKTSKYENDGNIMVVGDTGFGKTRFLCDEVVKAARVKENGEYCPIIVISGNSNLALVDACKRAEKVRKGAGMAIIHFLLSEREAEGQVDLSEYGLIENTLNNGQITYFGLSLLQDPQKYNEWMKVIITSLVNQIRDRLAYGSGEIIVFIDEIPAINMQLMQLMQEAINTGLHVIFTSSYSKAALDAQYDGADWKDVFGCANSIAMFRCKDINDTTLKGVDGKSLKTGEYLWIADGNVFKRRLKI